MTKRANGEGSVYKRGDGVWTASLTYRDEQGQSKRRVVYGRTQPEARANMKEARQRLDDGAPVKDTAMTLAAWLDEWITKSLAASDRKQATKDLYGSIARSHLAPVLGTRTLDKLRPSDVEALIVRKREAGLSASTIRTSTRSCARRWTSR